MTEKPTYDELEKKNKKLEQAELGGKQTEDALHESKAPIREKIEGILEPKGDTGTLSLGDIIDSEVLQSMMDDYYRLTNIGGAVLDISGNVLVSIGWQDICTKFHRCHPDTLKNCIESDTILSNGVPAGEFKSYRCKNNLWDMVTPIELGARHIGNIFLGQFFYEDEMLDYDLFRSQARQYGFDEKQYLAALDHVPRLSRETADTAMTFYAKLAGMISSLSYSTISLSHALSQQEMVLHKLSDSEKKFRSLFESINDCVFVHLLTEDDLPGHIIEVNDMACKKLGYSRQELLQLTPRDISAPDDGMNPVEIRNKLLAHGSTLFETMHLTKEGQLIPVESHIRLLDYDGHRAVLSIARDITERKQAEEDLLKERTLLKTIIDNIPVMLTRYNPDANMLYLNKEFEKKVGWTTEEVQDIDMMEKVYPDPEYRQQAMEYMQKARAEWREFKVMSKSGETIDSEWSNIRMEDGTHIGIGLDITERKRTEEELEISKKYLSNIINAIGDPVFVKDESFKFLLANDALLTLLGKTQDELIGTTGMEFLPPDQMDHFLDVDLKILVSGEENLTEESLTRHDGKILTIVTKKTRYVDGQGSKFIVGVIRDITEYKKMESQLIQSQKMESIGTLAGGIAHDFNNILSSVIGYTELALDGVDEGSDVEDDLQEVRKAGLRAKDLVKQILTFARQSDEVVKPIQVNIIAKEVVKFIKFSIPTNIQIKNKIISDSLIMGSPTQIHQILMNLCTNAAQAMEENGGILEVSVNDTTIDRMAIPDLNPGEYIKIKVTDTGMGISPQHIHTIFEPYFTTKAVGEGTGMGLAVVHGIVENYGGQITVDSTIGKGTCFTIYLPISKKRKVYTRSEKEDLPLGTENILFVDDEASIAKMGSKVLEQLGYTVTTRTSSVEALELFRSKPQTFDLVISDMTMPNMTGDKLAIELMKVRSDISVILCTGYSKKISEESAADIGIKALVYKPVVKADLAKTVRKVLDETKSSE
jgi:PAS domain S-box-containing protein